MSTWNVGGALRSSTDFWVPRRRASSSERVTVWMPPTRSVRVGFSMRFSKVLPCAVAMSCTPRSADAGMRDVAVASDLVRRVDDNDALPELVREHARDLAQHRRLADARTTEEQDASSRFDDVADDVDG